MKSLNCDWSKTGSKLVYASLLSLILKQALLLTVCKTHSNLSLKTNQYQATRVIKVYC